MFKHYIISICCTALFASLLAQEPLSHEKKIYVSPDQRVFINKELPVYFKVSTSPDNNGQSYVLPSEQTAMYANPMYFDTEGVNTLRSPSAVDKATRKVVQPKRDVLFNIYADGESPNSIVTFSGAPKYVKGGITYYGKNLKVNLSSKDATSGVQAIYVSVDRENYKEYANVPATFEEEKQFKIAYYSVDNVGNVEAPKTESFQVDISAPTTNFNIIGDSKGVVLSSKAFISFASKDSISGVSRIMYSINNGPEKVYNSPISLAVLKDGKSQITYYSVDNVGNKEEVKVISASTGPMGEDADRSAYSFYIDKEPPVIGYEIVGDQYKGKHLFVSARSLFQVNASDEKSGVAKTIFSYDNVLLRENYTEPFSLRGDGQHFVAYAAADHVGNMALVQTQPIYVDRVAPVSTISFKGNTFTNRDTLFITSSTKIVIAATENASGLQMINYNLDEESKAVYSTLFEVGTEGFHTLSYFATDNVNNSEVVKKQSFFVDNTAPQIFYNFSVKAIGEKTVRDDKYVIYPTNTMLYIASTDNASGVELIKIKVNGKEVPAVNPLKGFLPGNYDIEISAFDVLKNKSSITVRFAIEQ